MGTEIKDIVVINITRETAKITRVGFGTPMVFGIHSAFAEAFRTYTSIQGVGEDFDITDEEYIAANALFSQELSPETIVIGKRAANAAQSDVVTVSNVQDSITYTDTINGTAFDFLSDSDATNLEIATGLVSAINLGSEPVTATDNSDGTYDVDADVEGVAFTHEVSDDGVGDGLTNVPTVDNVSVASELLALEQSFNDWYFLINTRRSTEDEQLLDITQSASFIEPRLKMYFYALDQASMLTAVTTDIGNVLKALAYDRTTGMYSEDQALYPECAWVGRVAPETPGSVNWKFQQLAGISPDSLSSNDITNLKAANLNFFEEVAGVNIISSEAVVASGEYIDIIRGSDKLSTRMAERIFTTLVNAKKVPITNDGGATFENDMRAELQISVDEGFLVGDSIIVTVPDASDISPADKAERFFSGITFSGDFQGATNKVGIAGTLSL